MENKKAILVCGMHRSGTSATTGVINILGAYLGEKLLPTHSCNPKGYFENEQIYLLNEEILQDDLGSSCHDCGELNIDINKESIILKIEKLITDIFKDDKIICIKDPRLCLLLPFYTQVITKLNYKIFYIRVGRHWLESAKSYHQRDGFSMEKCIMLVEKYNRSLDAYLPSGHILIQYDDLLNDTKNTLLRLQEYLPFLNYSDENKNKIEQFLDKKLKHY